MKLKYIFACSLILLLSFGFFIKNDSFTLNSKTKLIGNNKEVLKKYGYVDGYNCKKITVLDEDGKLQGKYNLEDYVAGVVSGETHILDDEVSFQAMSVAIRTYALYVTNNCKYPIKNSEAHQVMSTTVSNKIKKAVAKTKGQVLTLNGKLVMAEYDSFYMGDGFYCDKKFCYSIYRKAGNSTVKNEKTHKIKVPASWSNDLSGGHGHGMSQYGALYLSKQGYTYDKILKYFYADGTIISTIVKPNVRGLWINNNFASRVDRPYRNNNFYYVNGEVPSNTLEGESTWYVTSRANEILKAINSTKKVDYFDDTNKYCNLINFEKSNDYTKPKEGSIISWGNHVAIVENVEDDKIDITEAYPALGYYDEQMAFEKLNIKGKFYDSKTNRVDRKYNCEKNSSGCFARVNNIKISDLKNRWGYDFKCYVYLVD